MMMLVMMKEMKEEVDGVTLILIDAAHDDEKEYDDGHLLIQLKAFSQAVTLRFCRIWACWRSAGRPCRAQDPGVRVIDESIRRAVVMKPYCALPPKVAHL